MKALLPIAGALILAACSREETPEAAPSPTATPAAAMPAKPRTMIAADFAPDSLGARIAGLEVADAAVGAKRRPIARVTAYVACAKAVTVCDPATLPAGTKYTYVLTITPVGPDEAPATPAATPPPVALVVPVAGALATMAPVPGFAGAVGYSRSEAVSALGAEDAISVTLDQGRIVWRARDGAQWAKGKPITIWWQSTQPPAAELTPAYELAAGDAHPTVEAPFPAAAAAQPPKSTPAT